MNRMTFKRLIGILVLSIKRNGFERAEYLKKKKVFASMGENCFWQPRNIPPESELIKLHDNVVIASEVLFVNHDVIHHVFRQLYPEFEFPTKYGAIEIGNHVFIGSRCVILPNSKIDDYVIIEAGSVVTGHLESGGVYAGSPAKRIGDFDKVLEKRTGMTKNGKSRSEYLSDSWREFDHKFNDI